MDSRSILVSEGTSKGRDGLWDHGLRMRIEKVSCSESAFDQLNRPLPIRFHEHFPSDFVKVIWVLLCHCCHLPVVLQQTRCKDFQFRGRSPKRTCSDMMNSWRKRMFKIRLESCYVVLKFLSVASFALKCTRGHCQYTTCSMLLYEWP